MPVNYQHLQVVEDGAVFWVTLDRPQSLNALNPRMIEELQQLFSVLYTREDVRVVVLRGAGQAFCAGLDLKAQRQEIGRLGVEASLSQQRSIRDIIISMRRCPQPIIALVHGAASGGGFALALASDVRIATPAARMNAAFIRIGLSACDVGVSYFLSRMIGSSAAAEYMLTGRFIDAERARELGLVSRIVAAEALEREARSLIEDMLNATPLGLRLTKDALTFAVDGASLEAVIAMEDRNQVLCTQGEDFAEGIAAFLEKRLPRYGGGEPA